VGSVWLEGTPAPRAALAGAVRADVAVVGAGIAGVATAYAFARQGASVVLLEERAAAAAASGRNAGFLLAGVAENFVAAVRRYGEERALRVWAFTRSNLERIRALVTRHRIECDLAWPGSLQIAGDEEEWGEIRESVRRLTSRGVRAYLDPQQRAACVADDGEFHPVRFVHGLARVAEEAGAKVFERTRAVSVTPREVRTDHGTVRAGAVILCTNAYTTRLAASRIRPVRGQMLATAPWPTRLFTQPAYAHRGYRYWRQTSDGRVLVGGWRNIAADEEVGEEERTTERVQRALDSFLSEHRISAPVTHRWAGIMGFSHDSLPYIGRRSDGMFICGGFTGHGNAFAMCAADLVAALVRGGSHPDADLFDPERP
jgi:gamma-glutamylputrescine oxidase